MDHPRVSSKASLLVRTTDVRSVARASRELLVRVPRPSVGFAFVSGQLARDAEHVAQELACAWPGIQTVVVPSAGLLSDEGDAENESAAALLLGTGGSARGHAFPYSPGSDRLDCLSSIANEVRDKRGTALVFAEPDAIPPGLLDHPSAPSFGSASVFGGGTPQGLHPVLVSADGSVHSAPVVSLQLSGVSCATGVSPGGRLVQGRLFRATEARGQLLLELDGRPALDVLTELAGGLERRPLIMVLRTYEEQDPMKHGRLRPIRGVNPDKKAVVVGDALIRGELMGFVAVEPSSARSGLEATMVDLEGAARGCLPTYGIVVSCAGRGSAFYGTDGAESRVVKQRFRGLPFVGMLGSFELFVQGGRLTQHFFTATCGIFARPS